MNAPLCTVWILGDQLLAQHPALAAAQATTTSDRICILLIESRARLQKHPYQRKKLVLLLSAMRHYAAELEAQGYRVDYQQAATFATGLRQHMTAVAPDRMLTMAASSYEGRQWQQERLSALVDRPVNILPNSQFLVGRYNPIPQPEPDRRYVMEHFYRSMRRHFAILIMPDGEPVGGQWNFDKENRQPLPADRHPPADPSFPPDELTRQVMAEVAQLPAGHGSVDQFAYAVTRKDALAAFDQFRQERLADFGPYEDALAERSHSLYHSVLSSYLNLGLLEPLELIEAVVADYEEGQAPINSVEGFVRQILGWREFMYWQYWRQMPGMTAQNAWRAERPLPAFFWTGRTDLACLRHALKRVHATGYNHHIERLMLLSNFAMLTSLNPAAVNDWFLALYIDAYEWVMPPNVIGMALNADDGLTATKPYIASANYINKMGDHCAGCRFNPKQRHGPDACPFNYLYWHFLLQHEARLRANPRLGRNVLGLRHLDEAERAAVRQAAAEFLKGLSD